jgi:hypothetical protein
MKLSNIEELIQKYDEGETSLQEEQELADFFSQEQVPPHLQAYAAQFQFFSNRKRERAADAVMEEKIIAAIEKADVQPVKKVQPMYFNWGIGIAASICFLIIGFIGGRMSIVPAASTENIQMVELKNDVKEMKQMVMFSMLKQQSASERLKAVNYVKDLADPDPKTIAALLKTLNEDDNINVRLAAARALAGFPAVKSVRQGLVDAMAKQTDPIIQLALIDIFVELEEKRAVDQLKKLLENTETLDVVKEEAKRGLSILA